MTTPTPVPSPQVRHLSAAPAPVASAVVPVQPAVLPPPVVVPLQGRALAQGTVRRTLAEAQAALAVLGRTS